MISSNSNLRSEFMVITIDGLGVNGKSTLAKRISNELNFKNFNTGAIYRCIALQIIENKLDINKIEQVLNYIREMEVDFESDKIYLNKRDVTTKIRTEQISVVSTKWATIPKIKEFVRNFQKDFIEKNDTVMEGRDIGTRIAPNAEVKFYLYSDFETRVERLWNKNKKINIEEIRENLKIRDDLDINGGNFVKPKNAIEIDTTNYTLDEVYQIMINEVNKVLIYKDNK